MVHATLNSRVKRLPDIVDVLTDIGSESGVDIQLKRTGCVLTGSWQQLSQAKCSLEKRFTSTTIVNGSINSSELSDDSCNSSGYSAASMEPDVDSSIVLLAREISVKDEGVSDDSDAESSGELRVETPPDTVEVSSPPESLVASQTESSAPPGEATGMGAEAATETHGASGNGACVAPADQVIPVDIDIWQYIERHFEHQLDAIESDYGVSITPLEQGDVLMVKISGSDNRRASDAHWRFIELHTDVLTRVVVEICEPPRQLYDSADIKAARKRVQSEYRDTVLVKAEKGRYVFIGEADIAKEARYKFMELAHLLIAPPADLRQKGSPARLKQRTSLPFHTGSGRPRQRASEPPSELASPQRHKSEDIAVRDVAPPAATRQPSPEREIPTPPNNKSVTFSFESQLTPGCESVRVRKASYDIVAAQPQPGTLPTARSPPTSQDVDSLVDVDRSKVVKSQSRHEPDGRSARTDTTRDNLDSDTRMKHEVAVNDSVVLGTVSGVSDSTDELFDSDHPPMPDLERIYSDIDSSSDTGSVDMENEGRERSATTNSDRLSDGTPNVGFDETRYGDVRKIPSRPTSDVGDDIAMPSGASVSKDLTKASSRDRDPSSGLIGIVVRPHAARTATEDDVLPCYPDANTRHNMVQQLLDKNDPRFGTQLQKLMNPQRGVDVNTILASLGQLSLTDFDLEGHDTDDVKTGLGEPGEHTGCKMCGNADDQCWSADEGGLICTSCLQEFSPDAGVAKVSPTSSLELPDARPNDTKDDHDIPETLTTKQPFGGTISKLVDTKSDLPGYQQVGTIMVTYDFPVGTFVVCV